MAGLQEGVDRRLATLWAALGYIAAACLSYGAILTRGRFLCDDVILLSRIKRGLGIWDYRGADFYRPTISSVLTTLWRLFGNNPMPYYVFNVLVLVGTGLVIRAIWLSFVPGNRSAFAVGLIFVLWITHSESVSWISGMTDGVSVFVASLALLAFVKYRAHPTVLGFLGVLILLWLGLLGKEGIITWVPILMVFGLAMFPVKKQWRLCVAEVCVLAVVGGLYVAWRTHVLGKLIGGYGSSVHLNVTPAGLSTKLARHLANAFLPFNKWIALWINPSVMFVLTTAATVGVLALLIRKAPRERPTPPWALKLFGVLTVIGLVRVTVQALPDFLFEQFGPRVWGCGALVGIAAFWFLRKRKVLDLGSDRGFWMGSVLCLLLHAYTGDRVHDIVLLFVYLWFAFETRPIGPRSANDLQLMRLGLVGFVSTFLAIIPTVTLKVDLNGEASRFSYGPSFFAAFALASVVLLYVKKYPARLAVAAPAFLASGILLYENNIPWALASDLSGETTEAIKNVLPARRIYVLSLPGGLGGSFLFRIGIEHFADVTLGDENVEVRNANYQILTMDGDSLKVKKIDDATYGISLFNNAKIHRFEATYLQVAEPEIIAGWFSFPAKKVDPNAPPDPWNMSLVHLVGFQKATDHVIVVDGTSARVIQ
jgi:hypothetical protein